MRAVQLAIDEENEKNPKVGDQDVTFKLLAQDDRVDANLAVNVANYFIKAGVVGVIGNTNTTNSMATSAIFNDAELAHISPSTTGKAYTEQGHRSAFRMVGRDDKALQLLAPYLVHSLKAQKIAVIDNQTAFGTAAGKVFKDAVNETGGHVVMSGSVSSRTSDFNAVLTHIRQAQADYVFFGGTAEQGAALARNINRMGLSLRLVSAMAGMAGNLFLTIEPNAAAGTLSVEPGQPLHQMPGWKVFEKRYIGSYGNEINQFTIFAYDAAKVLIQAIKDSKTIDRARIVESLHKIDYMGATGPISFDSAGDRNFSVFTVYEVQQHKWLPVKILSPS